MTNEKRQKPKIKRRPPGLVITPPAPRPVGEDHPARLLFREAIESSKESTAEPADAGLSEVAEPSVTADEAVSASIPQAQAEPLQIFKELREATSAPDERVDDVVLDAVPLPEATDPSAEVRKEISSPPDAEAFEAHFGQWRPFLSEAQMCVLEALYNMTHAGGTSECLTSMPKLAAAAGVSERQTYNVVKELERNGFIERPETFNTPTKKGTVFRLLLSRRTTPGLERRYYLGD
jgi:DNA-binding MarR family transcriptional regulator